MALYENVFIARQDVPATQVETLTTQFSELVTAQGGTVSKKEYWGLRSLTFRIKKNRKGHYTLLNIDAPSAAIKELERTMSINEDIIRSSPCASSARRRPVGVMQRSSEKSDRPAATDPDRGGWSDRPPRRERPRFGEDLPVAAVREKKNERPTSSLHPPAQELPVLRRQCAQDRLQGRAPAAALRLRARQDRAEPHIGGVVQEAARARPGDQARPLPGAPALLIA
jgi:ribosomal protein S6